MIIVVQSGLFLPPIYSACLPGPGPTDTRGKFGKPHVEVSLTVRKYYYFGGPYGFDIPLQGLPSQEMNKSF